MTDAGSAIAFLEGLLIPEGPRADEPLRLAPFQRAFVEGALAPETMAGALSIARGNAKSALPAGVALGALCGAWDQQPRREVALAGRARDQARVTRDFASAFARTLPTDEQKRLMSRRGPILRVRLMRSAGRTGEADLARFGSNCRRRKSKGNQNV